MEKKLFKPAKLGNLTLKNRLVRSALFDGAALPDGGLKDEACRACMIRWFIRLLRALEE